MRIILTWIFGIALGLLMMVSTNAWDARNNPMVAESLFISGLFLVGIAVIGRLWCSVYIAGKKDQVLVTDGPYSLCRNPLYFFSFLGAMGIGFSSETFTVPLIILVSFSIYYPYVIRSEEIFLQGAYGVAYQEYTASTPRFFPSFRHISEPRSYSVDPFVFRKHCLSAFGFILVVGLLEAIETLHDIHVLPNLLYIY